MSKIIAAAIKERKVTIFLSIVVLLFGAYSYYFIPKQENPDTSAPIAQVITTYPGASANDIEALITKKIEDSVAELEGVEYIKSFSYDNASIVMVMLNYEVDYEEQWEQLRINIDEIANELPSDAWTPEVKTELSETAGMILSVSGDDYSYDQLEDIAVQYKEKLEVIPGIKRIDIEGSVEKELVIEIHNEKLAAYNISTNDIYDMIRAQNVEIPSGAIKTETGKINLKTPDSLSSQRDLEELIIYVSEDTGSVVRLKDVASVSFDYVDNSLRFRDDGRPAVLVTGYFMENQNVVLIGKDVRDELDQMSYEMPDNISINEVLFLPEDVDGAVSDFIINLLQGIFFVILVVLIGMGLRNAMIVSVTIPLSIASTFIAMTLLGIEIQQVSIAALIIALGILVDNSIVISDAVQIKINEGLSMFEASFQGTKEQAIPVLASTLTTIASFAPLVVLPGEAGVFTKSLPQVVMISLIASFVVAMLVTPALASKFFHKSDKNKDSLSRIKKQYHKLLNINLNRPKTALAVTIIIFLIVMGTMTLLEIRMFPYIDKNIIYFSLTSEVSGDIEKNEEFVKSVEEMLSNEPEITSMTSSVGGGLPRFYMTADIITPSDDKAQILSQFDLKKSGRFNTAEELAIYLQDKFDSELVGGYATANLLEINVPGPAIEIRLSGKDLTTLNDASSLVYEELLDINGTINVQNDNIMYKYVYALDVDQDLATTFGLTKYDIQYQINLALNGNNASIMKVDGEEYNIRVVSDISSLDDILNLPIKSQHTGEKILVKQFADVKLEEELTAIKRYDRNTLVSVTADARPGVSSSDIQAEIEAFINENIDTKDIKVVYGGDSDTMSKYLTGLISAGLAALIVVYVILMIQFNSFKQPFIILASIPLSFIGVILALLMTNTPFTFTVGLGIASLFGIVVNNAILLIEYINRAREEGMDVREACEDSVEKRMRPILLSSITTIFGLIPLVLAQSSFFSPMAIALIGGLLVSTLLTLTVIPTIYYLVERRN
ncbi:efflux RND transporter permease subunit [Acidaminobacter sp. JC074]|uniref:efflux RND transporter permease subunit n=1 Tax=Acidaminobacter sp. JC074 TaxID=2530199 RepID=UPI001F0DC429|nr:efflux RND transporter permease subunit [Acidaminobacter sp. JC074]MCH4886199.1 efflux RND transporter permease subunit [Acidaminobacter sp. JC074]